MNVKGLLLGSLVGILAAAVLIAGVSLAGTGAQHIDLLPGSQPTQQNVAVSSQVVGPTVSPGQEGSQLTTSSQTQPNASNPPATSPNGGESALGLLSPFILAAALGAAFYGLYARRVDAE